MTTAFSKVPKGKPLAFGDRKPLGGPTLEQARQQMIEAAEFRPRDGRVPSFIASARAEQDAPPVEVAPATAAEPAAPVVQAAPVPTRQPAKPEQQAPLAAAVETTEAFVEEDRNSTRRIYRAGRDWVAEIRYKNGAGEESFRAANYRELLMKILTGKSHATLKIRAQHQELNRTLHEGFKFDGWPEFENKVFASANGGQGISREEYQKLPESTQRTLVDLVQATEATTFLRENPTYLATQKNHETICGFLSKKHKVPPTARNLQFAFSELKQKLETKENAEPPHVQSTPAPPAVPAPQAASVVRKRGATGLIPGAGSAGNSRTRVTPSEITPERAKSMPLEELRKEMRREASVRAQGRG